MIFITYETMHRHAVVISFVFSHELLMSFFKYTQGVPKKTKTIEITYC